MWARETVRYRSPVLRFTRGLKVTYISLSDFGEISEIIGKSLWGYLNISKSVQNVRAMLGPKLYAYQATFIHYPVWLRAT